MKCTRLEKAVVLSLLLCGFNSYAGAEQITDSVTYDEDVVTVNGGDNLALDIYYKENNVVDIIFKEMILQVDEHAATSTADIVNSKVNFNGDKLTIIGSDDYSGLYLNQAIVNSDIKDIEITGANFRGMSMMNNSDFNAQDSNISIIVDRSNITDDYFKEITGFSMLKDYDGQDNEIMASNNFSVNNLNINVLTSENSPGFNSGMFVEKSKDAVINVSGNTKIDVSNGKYVRGIYSDGGTISFKGKTQINTYGNENTIENTGMHIMDSNSRESFFKAYDDVEIVVDGGKDGTGLYVIHNDNPEDNTHSIAQFDKKLDVKVLNTDKGNGIYAAAEGIVQANDVNVEVTAPNGTGIYSNGYVYIDGNADIKADRALYVEGEGKSIDVVKNFISHSDDSLIEARSGGTIQILGEGIVNYKGRIITGIIDPDSFTYFVMLNKDSYWEMTDDSNLSALVIDNDASLDMRTDKDKFSLLQTDHLAGRNGHIYMDIDASKNIENSDRIYVGEHYGTHYIHLNNVGSNDDGASGTVLVSVKDEKGEFKYRIQKEIYIGINTSLPVRMKALQQAIILTGI